MHLNVVVIEDEPIIAADLVDMLEKATVSIKVAARRRNSSRSVCRSNIVGRSSHFCFWLS